MKRFGSFLLAVVTVVGLAGCPKKDSPDVQQGELHDIHYTNRGSAWGEHIYGDVVNVGSEYASNVTLTFRWIDTASNTVLYVNRYNIGTLLENERHDFSYWNGWKGESHRVVLEISWD